LSQILKSLFPKYEEPSPLLTIPTTLSDSDKIHYRLHTHHNYQANNILTHAKSPVLPAHKEQRTVGNEPIYHTRFSNLIHNVERDGTFHMCPIGVSEITCQSANAHVKQRDGAVH
jgi:hypothetical protein